MSSSYAKDADKSFSIGTDARRPTRNPLRLTTFNILIVIQYNTIKYKYLVDVLFCVS